MDRRFITVLGVSLLFALIVSSLFYQISRGRRPAARAAAVPMKDVVVAARELEVGATIRPEDVKAAKLPAPLVPQGSFARVEEVVGRPVTSKILAGEPVLGGRLAERGSGFGLAPIIPTGMRAVSVRVNDVANVAGFALPGMRVDVLATLRPQGEEGPRTTTVLQNILVLSAGQQLQPDASGKPINVPVVTLLVTPEQAETLTLASNEGRIQLVLRNATDKEVQKTPGKVLAELYGAPRPVVRPQRAPAPARAAAAPPPSPAPRPAPEPEPDQIVVIRGTQKSIEVLGNARSN
jgi:pilus assembly protein CpaB